MRRSFLAAAGLAAVTLALAGCGAHIKIGTTPPIAAPAPVATSAATVRLGQPIGVITTDGGRAVVTVHSMSYATAPRAPGAPRPENGQYAIADISIAVTSGSYTYGAPYFGYQAANGDVYSWTDGHADTAGFEPEMQFGTLSAGQDTRGLVPFDVPSSAGKDLQLTGVAGAVIGEWTFPTSYSASVGGVTVTATSP